MYSRPIAAALSLALLSCIQAEREGRTTPPGGPLLRALSTSGPFGVPWAIRLSIPVTASGCAGADSLDWGRLACQGGDATMDAERLAGIAARASASLRNGLDTDALHAAALVDLVAGDPAGNSLDRSISYLEMITRLDSANAAAWTDLAAARLVRATVRPDAQSILLALEAASRALEVWPRSVAARFNRAVALDLLALDAQAVAEWRQLADHDPRSPWGMQAARRLARATGRRQTVRPAPDAAPESLLAFVDRDPYESRLFAWEALLGDWGRRLGAGETDRAEARLAAAEVMGNAIAARFGDSSIVAAVRGIRALTPGSSRQGLLARAHARYAEGRARAAENLHAAADSAFVEVLTTPASSLVLRQWATLGHANSLIYLREPERAASITSGLLAQLDSRAHPSLAGRAAWILAVLHLRQGRDSAGRIALEHARGHFERAGERDNLAATASLAGERALLIGDNTGYGLVLDALRALRDYPVGLWRHNALYLLAVSAARLGLPRAAMAIVDEDAMTAGASRAASIAELRMIRARALWETGDTARAEDAIRVAASTIDSLTSTEARQQLGAELKLTLATGPMRADRARALATLDTVITYFTGTRNVAKLIPAHVGRAGAALALGDLTQAERDLARAAALYDDQRATVANLPERAALQARAQTVVDRLVMVRLAQQQVDSALAALERGRAAFSTVGAGRRRARPRRFVEGLTLDLHLVGDTLLAFVLDSSAVHLERSVLPRVALLEVLERVRTAFELGMPEDAVRPDLARLHEWLLRPVATRLAQGAGPLTIVGTGALASVPFAALYDARAGRYVVESWATRWAPSLADAWRAPREPATVTRALVVAEPRLEARVFPALGALAAAGAETESVASHYGGARVLRGVAADSGTISQALVTADLFHFSGHAVFDDARPHVSHLAVMPRGLGAAAIAALDLRRLRLAVLSACETMRSPERRGEGFTGLTEAFLAAGADGVIGSLWRVDDAATAALMTAFHRAYAASGDAAAALREAQLELLRSGAGGRRAPGAWGAFRLAGR